MDYAHNYWGSGGLIQVGAPSLVNDPAAVQSMGKFESSGASPSALSALMKMNSQIDISAMLPSTHVPTLIIHKTGDMMVPV